MTLPGDKPGLCVKILFGNKFLYIVNRNRVIYIAPGTGRFAFSGTDTAADRWKGILGFNQL